MNMVVPVRCALTEMKEEFNLVRKQTISLDMIAAAGIKYYGWVLKMYNR